MRGYEGSSSSENDFKNQLRIPMRGYEPRLINARFKRLASYESPCGVMRQWQTIQKRETRELRIPMRGYENRPQPRQKAEQKVTNPHAGL